MDLRVLLGKRLIIDLASELVKLGDADRANRRVERTAAKQSDLVAGHRAAAQPSAEDERDQRILVAVDAEQREKTRVSGGDVPEFAADHERELVVAKDFDPVAAKHERVRLAEAERRNRNVVVLARKNERHRNLERRARAL